MTFNFSTLYLIETNDSGNFRNYHFLAMKSEFFFLFQMKEKIIMIIEIDEKIVMFIFIETHINVGVSFNAMRENNLNIFFCLF